MNETRGNRRAITRLGLAEWIAAVTFIAWSARFVNRASFLAIDGSRYWGIFDDAIISMRYAWNLSHGSGLVWNPGERVEGYSNLITTLVMTAACALFDRRTAALAMQLLGVVTVLAVAHLTARFATRFDCRTMGEESSPRSLAFCSALLFYPLSYWSLGGMETGLVTLLFVTGLLAVERWEEAGRRRYLFACGLAQGLVCIARPDGILLALLCGLSFTHAACRRDRASALSRILVLAGIAVILPAVQLCVRAVYYGALVPNTYVLKLGNFPIAERLRGGAGFVWPFAPLAAALLVPIALGLWRRPSRPKALAAVALLTLLGYQIAIGGDPWPYWRIMTPAITLAAAVAAHEIWNGIAGAASTGAGKAIRRAGAIGVLGALFLVLNGRFIREATFDRRPYQWEANVRNVNVAIALAEIAKPTASVGVFWAGSIPYYTGLRAVDFLGKSDPIIAHMEPDLTGAVAWSGMPSVPGHNKYDLNYSIVELRPTYVQGFHWGRQDLAQWGRAHYDSVVHRGVALWLRRGATEVRWDRVHP